MANRIVDTPGTIRPLLRLALPVLAEHLLHLLVMYVDLWLAGNFLPGEAYVAAMTLTIYVTWIIANLFSFIALGSTALTARFVGAGDHSLADRVMHQSLLLGGGGTIALMLLLVPQVGLGVSLMGLSGPAAAAAAQYLEIEILMLPAIMVLRVGIACLRGAGDTFSGMVTMGIVNIVNMVMSFLLVTGAGPAPELGWIGLPLGTAAGYLTGAAIVLGMLFGGRAGYRLRPRMLRPDGHLIRRILRIGIPGGTDIMLITCCHLLYLRVVLQLGDVAAAAHGVAIQIEALGYMPATAFQIAASTLAGQYLGAQDFVRARRSVWMAVVAATVCMVPVGTLFYVGAVPLASFFLGGRAGEVIPLAATLLRLISLVLVPLAMSMVLSGALRGAGDTRWPLAFTVLSMLGIRVPLAAVFAYSELAIPLVDVSISGLGWGVIGAWYAGVTDILVRCLLMVLRFCHGGWQRIAV